MLELDQASHHEKLRNVLHAAERAQHAREVTLRGDRGMEARPIDFRIAAPRSFS